MSKPFWQQPLSDLSRKQWESLCDGCAQCCLVKLEDEETEEVYATSVSCRLLDTETCRCKDYPHRFEQVAECVRVTLEKPEQFDWMPTTCVYRLLYEGKPLPDWHPLVSGSHESVHQAGVSIKAYAISEDYVHPDQLEEFIIEKLNNPEK